MTYDTAIKLAVEIKESEEYKGYETAYAKIKDNETTVALLKEYRKLQMELQSMMYTGAKDDDKADRYKKLSELLTMDKDAADYLMAEYRLNRIVGDIYKIIADAANIDFGI